MSNPLDLEIGLCWGTLQRASLPELIEAAGRHGFPTLSVRPDSVRACLDSGTSEVNLRRHLGDAGVRVRVIDALGGGMPGMAAATAAAPRRASKARLAKMIPLRTRRSSTRGLPWLLGKYGNKLAICSSVSQYRSLMHSLLAEPESHRRLPIIGS